MKLVLGLARATKGVVDYLSTIGVDFKVYDDDKGKLDGYEERYTDSLDGIDSVITSPGFSPDHPMIKKAITRKLEVIDELEFTYQEINGRVIAITGTNGKSTTTGLIGNILKPVKRIFTGGNIAPGRPYSSALLEPPYDYYVLEVSSFQLERIKDFHPFVAVVTNIGADHLNRHKSVLEYTEAKLRIFSNQGHSDHAIINRDDSASYQHVSQISSIPHYFSLSQEADAMIKDGFVVVNGKEIMAVDEIAIPGRHNQANVLAAVLATSIIGIRPEQIKKGIRSFTGLPFRMEKIREKDGIVFVNNSMCTNPRAAIASLEAVTEPYVVILGGSEKGIPDDLYPEYVVENANYAVVVGANRSRIAEVFKKSGFENFAIASSIEDAVEVASGIAQPGWWVILNPGYASFDMFRDFEERGQRYNDAVATI